MKLQDTKFIRQHLFLIILSFITLILCGCFYMLASLSQNSTLALETLKGDVTVLNDVIITGELSDGCYTTPFDIQNGNINYHTHYITHEKQDHRYEMALVSDYDSINHRLYDTYFFYAKPIFDIPNDAERQITKIIPTFDLPDDDFSLLDSDSKYLTITQEVDTVNLHITLEASSFHDKFDFLTPKISNFRNGNNVSFDTGIYIKRPTGHIILEENYLCPTITALPTDNLLPKPAILKRQNYTLDFNIDNLTNGLTLLNDTAYYVPPVSSKFSGTASLYRIETFAPHTFYMADEESLLAPLGTIVPIYSVNLDSHHTSILGLENVNNYLVLLLMVDDQLVFQTIDPLTGTLISEISTANLNIPNTSYEYIPFISDNSLSIIFNNSFIVGLSISTTGQITTISPVIATDYTDLNYHYSFLTFVNNKLFLFNSVWDSETFYGPTFSAASATDKTATTTTRTTIVEDYSLVLSVYEDTQLIYKGKFLTDSFQDEVFLKQSYRLNNTAVPSSCISRTFNSLYVKGAS